MTTMEFEEMKKIWDTQNDEPLYVINQKALHNRILTKKKRAGHVANFTEALLIVVNAGSGVLVLGMTFFKQRENIYMYLLSAWMFMTSIYTLAGSIRRRRGEHKFDRSLLGDLSHAISNATYQVRLSGLMRLNIIPIALLLLFGLMKNDQSIWFAAIMLLFFVLVYFASGWEHAIYDARKRELEILKGKLTNE